MSGARCLPRCLPCRPSGSCPPPPRTTTTATPRVRPHAIPLLSRTALVINLASRGGAPRATFAESLIRAAQGRWGRLSLHPATDGRGLGPALEDALTTGPDLLVVGGDGTLARAADAVAGTGVVLGMLPLGTAKDATRALGLPRDLPGAVHALISGQVVDVDLGRADGRALLDVASIGLSAGVAERLSPDLSRRLGPLAHPVTTLASYRTHQPFAARLEFPDGDHPTLELCDLLLVAVANGRHHGGGTTGSATAPIDCQHLDVYAVERGRARDHVSIARRLRDGTFVEHARVRHLTTTAVRLLTEPAMPVDVDGEVVAGTPLTFGVEAGRRAVGGAPGRWGRPPRPSGAAYSHLSRSRACARRGPAAGWGGRPRWGGGARQGGGDAC